MSASEIIEKIQDEVEDVVSDVKGAIPEPVNKNLAKMQDTINEAWAKIIALVPADKLPNIDLPTPANVVDDGFGAAKSVLDAQHRFALKLVGGEAPKKAPAKKAKATAKKATAKKAPAKKATAAAKKTTAKKATKKTTAKKTTAAAATKVTEAAAS